VYWERGPEHWAQLAGLSFAGGFGVVGLFLFLVSLCGSPPTRTSLIALAACVAVALVVLGRRRTLLVPTRPEGWPRRIDARAVLAGLAALLLLAAATSVVVQLLTPGMADVDAYAIWVFKAKVIAAQPLRPVPAAMLAPALSYSHQDYPLGFPFVIAGLWAMAGHSDETLAKLVQLPVYLSLVAVMYGSLRSMLHRRAEAICVTAVFATAPVLVLHAGQAVAEAPLVLMHACSLVLLLRWMGSGGRRGELIACALFAAFAAFTKNEGLALLPIVFGAALAAALAAKADQKRKLLRDWLIAGITAAVLIAPWLLYRTRLPKTHEDYGAKLTHVQTVIQNLPRLGQVLRQYLGLFVQFDAAGPIWVVLIVVAFVGCRRFGRREVLVLWALLIAHLALYVATFVVTPWDLAVLMPMVGPKLVMHASPTAALLIALHLNGSGKRDIST
jgi:4-amino-4-deoxy-L-arabinose transferase-like glycosyltransferase